MESVAPTRPNVQRRVMAYVRQERLFVPGDRIVVGVSGGPDSLCLLHVLRECRQALGIELTVAHLNHAIRGAEADADARYVAALAERWQMPCVVERRDVPATARAKKLAIEEAARRAILNPGTVTLPHELSNG